MSAKTILFSTDFSDASHAALEHASALASESRAMLYIVHVDEISDEFVSGFSTGLDGYGHMTAPENTRDEIVAHLKEVTPTIDGVKCEHCYLRGNVAREILKFADEHNVEMIVMGTHGRSGISRLLMGSVAEVVVRRAKCPVLTVKQPADRPEEVTAGSRADSVE